MIQIICKKCGKSISFAGPILGKSARCPKCNVMIKDSISTLYFAWWIRSGVLFVLVAFMADLSIAFTLSIYNRYDIEIQYAIVLGVGLFIIAVVALYFFLRYISHSFILISTWKEL